MSHGFSERSDRPINRGRELYELLDSVMQERFAPSGRSHMPPWEILDRNAPQTFPSEKDAWDEIARRFIERYEQSPPF